MPAAHNPSGAKSDKIWRAAVQRAVKRETKGKGSRQWLDKLADKLVRVAHKGDVSALREIGDRLDGKPAQALQIKGDPDSPVIFNLRLGDGLPPKLIDGGQAEVMDQDALVEPLVAIATQDDESPR